MPPTPRRASQRPRRNSQIKDAVADQPDDSSPPRPAKRRKQANDAAHDLPSDLPEEESSSLLADNSAIAPKDDTQLVARVTQHLLAPPNETVRASQVHSNAIHEANTEGVQAFAKIAAQDWTFYVTDLSVKIGRMSEPLPDYSSVDPESDPDYVHIDLGPSKMVSRQHAQIVFNTKSEKWYVHVKGRNGVKINNQPWRVGQSTELSSGNVLEIGGVEMMFVLPLETSPLHIHDFYLKRAGLPTSELDGAGLDGVPHHLGLTPPSGGLGDQSPRVSLPRGQPAAPQSIAPAPPEYKRPGTPPSSRNRTSVPGSSLKSPHFRDSPTMVVHPNDVDLSLDENKNLKPQYSYAQMITQAIMNTPDGKLNLNGIYNFIMDNYSYYKHQQAAGWQNSIRHNLSLNKAFEKVARSTEEPGKGMKWYILPEYKDEMVRTAYRGGRGGHRGSSNPSSPSQLNYVNQGPRDLAARDIGSGRKRRLASPLGSPQPRSTLRNVQMTPDRHARRLLPDEALGSFDGSPLPRYRRVVGAGAGADLKAAGSTPAGAATSAGDATGAASESIPRSPTLTSAFLQDEQISSFVTPAPHRVELKLNPPSTLQRPSQHMPTSSPAPFWRYADIGSTPLRPVSFDSSPSKVLGLLASGGGGGVRGGGGGGGGGPETVVASSSPPRAPSASVSASASAAVAAAAAAAATEEKAADETVKPEESSPARPLHGDGAAMETTRQEPSAEDALGTLATTATAVPPAVLPARVQAEEDGGFDLTKGFQSIGSYHAPARHGLPVATATNGSR